MSLGRQACAQICNYIHIGLGIKRADNNGVANDTDARAYTDQCHIVISVIPYKPPEFLRAEHGLIDIGLAVPESR